MESFVFLVLFFLFDIRLAPGDHPLIPCHVSRCGSPAASSWGFRFCFQLPGRCKFAGTHTVYPGLVQVKEKKLLSR